MTSQQQPHRRDETAAGVHADHDAYLIDDEFDDFLDRELARSATSLTSATCRRQPYVPVV